MEVSKDTNGTPPSTNAQLTTTDQQIAIEQPTTNVANIPPTTEIPKNAATDIPSAPVAIDVTKQMEPPVATTVQDMIFNKSNFILLVWFLVIYILAYFLLGMFFGTETTVSGFQASLGKLLDFIFLCGFIGYTIAYFYYSPEGKLSSDAKQVYDQIIEYLKNSYSLVTTTLFIIVFYLVVYLFRVPMSAEVKPIFISIIENTAWIGLLVVVIVNFFKYVLGIPLDDILDKLNPFGEEQVVKTETKEPRDEVFNVSNNLYTYDDAQAVCSSFGAKLATYDQIEAAYNNGAEWCNYGWSANQMAFFPTQKATWDTLQQSPTQKNNCGRPGVNGGYIENPYIKFGVNCYGKKPKPTEADLNRLDAKQHQLLPKSQADKELDKKVQHWKENADKLLQLSSYNNNSWSQY